MADGESTVCAGGSGVSALALAGLRGQNRQLVDPGIHEVGAMTLDPAKEHSSRQRELDEGSQRSRLATGFFCCASRWRANRRANVA
jgi:hypothetical protein